MSSNTDDCTAISALCPVEATIYGYYPNLGANAFFCAFFFTFTIVNLILTFRYKTRVFSSLILIGCVSEAIGYVGRVIMHSNPWSNAGFQTQICTLIFAPSFFAAALYLTLKQIVQSVGPEFSVIKAILYPWIFIICDFISLLLQAIGGATAATASTESGAAMGGHIMLAGIVFQVATFTFLYILTAIFIIRLRASKSTLSSEVTNLLNDKKFKLFLIAILVASLAIYFRCVYRIAELAQGWANQVMRDEVSFIVMDGVMCCIAAVALTIAQPAILFKPMVSNSAPREKVTYETPETEA